LNEIKILKFSFRVAIVFVGADAGAVSHHVADEVLLMDGVEQVSKRA